MEYVNLDHSYYNSKVRDYFILMKPRVMSLVTFTGFAGLYLAPGTMHPFISFLAILAIALASGASGAINMWWERDTDRLMQRTASRPLALGIIDPAIAIQFAIAVAGFSVMLMGLATNMLAAFLLLCAILFYVFVYTIWLKKRTSQNIVIGGASGAFPPIIGWAAVTNNISLLPILIFVIIFMWTPWHFWSLSLYKNEDYQKAGIPMLPVTKGINYTKISILIYTILSSLANLAPYLFGFSGTFYLLTCCILNFITIYYAYKLVKEFGISYAPKLFKYSIINMFLVMLALIIDNIFG